MTIADGSQHTMFYIPEATYGVTPATPAWIYLAHTGTTLGVQKETLESEKLTGDRQITDLRLGNRTVVGDTPAELEHGSFDDLLEAVFMGTWAADELKTGADRRSFSLERQFTDLATPEYHRYTGGEVNSLNVSVAPNQMVTTTFNWITQDAEAPGTAPITGSTYSDPLDVEPFDSFTGTINEGGSAIAIVTALDFTLENGLNPNFALMSRTTLRPSAGKSRVTGTLTAYYESKALYEKYLNETPSSIDFTLVDPAGNSLGFSIPNLKYTSGQADISGEGSVTVPMGFTGIFDTVADSNIVATRS